MIRFDDTKGLKNLLKLMLIGTVISFILIFGYNKYQKEEFPQPTFEQGINGRISSLSTYQSVVMIKLESDEKYMIVDSRNYAYDPYLIQGFLRKGDYVEKKLNSDTIFVKRNDSTFVFVLGKDLNKKF